MGICCTKDEDNDGLLPNVPVPVTANVPVPVTTNVPVPELVSSYVDDTADIILHVDIDKTVVAERRSRGFHAPDVALLTRYRNDRGFLYWTYTTQSPLYDTALTPRMFDTFDEWVRLLTDTTHVKMLVALAQEYLDSVADPVHRMCLDALLAGVSKHDNSVTSFWEFLTWLRTLKIRVLVCFRTFENHLPRMFSMCERHGFSNEIVRGCGDFASSPLIWTVLHRCDKQKGFDAATMDARDVVYLEDGSACIQPGQPLPRNAAHPRTVRFKEAAATLFETRGGLDPLICTRFPEVCTDSCLPFVSELFHSDVHELSDMGALFSEIRFASNEFVKIMGIQDNYKPWSRQNPGNGKPIISDIGPRQLVFDDAAFASTDLFGAYAYSIYEMYTTVSVDSSSDDDNHAVASSMIALKGTKRVLQEMFSAHAEFKNSPGNLPIFFQTALVQPKLQSCAMGNADYFRDLMQSIILAVA